MRLRLTVLVSLLTTLGLPGVAPAAPRHNHGLTLTNVPRHIEAGDPVLLYGHLTGAGAAGQTIRLYHQVAPRSGYTLVGVTRTDSGGMFQFPRADGVVMTNRSWFVRGPERTHSRTVYERVDALVSLASASETANTRQAVMFTGHVTPAQSGRTVVLQQRTGDGDDWRTVRRAVIGGGSSFSITDRWLQPGSYDLRAVFPGDRRNARGVSDPVTITVQQAQQPGFTIATASPVITVGQSTSITGGLDAADGSTPVPGATVTLLAHTAGTNGFLPLAATTTAQDGGYRFTVTPERNTTYQVRTATAPVRRTALLYEAVRYVVTAQPSATSGAPGSTVMFTGTVVPGRPGGEVVYLQRLGADGEWHTVAATVTNAAGGYTAATALGSAPTEQFRTRALGDGLNRSAVSPVSTVTVTNPQPSSLPPAS